MASVTNGVGIQKGMARVTTEDGNGNKSRRLGLQKGMVRVTIGDGQGYKRRWLGFQRKTGYLEQVTKEMATVTKGDG